MVSEEKAKEEKTEAVPKENPAKKAKEEKKIPEASEKKEAPKKESKKETVAKDVNQELWNVVKFPHLSEKSIANIEAQNKLVFIVKNSATRKDIKEAVEKIFQVKVLKVNMLTTTKGEKKAFVRLDEKSSAADIATRLGMM